MLVKICGVTRPEDARLAAALGAGAVGMVFWAGSPRAVTADRARCIVRALPDGVLAVGVFVGESAEVVAETADRVGLSAVQMHGDTTAAGWSELTLPVISAVAVQDLSDAVQACDLPPHHTVLVDTFDRAKPGGTGRVGNWQAAALVARRRRVILAGGLDHRNVEAAIASVRPHGVDVSSGVESTPGVKDPQRLMRFFAAVGRATATEVTGDRGC